MPDAKNRQMALMLAPAQERLTGRDIAELCQNAAVSLDCAANELLLPSMGEVIHIRLPDFVITQELDMWRHLTLLQYLDTADGDGGWESFDYIVNRVSPTADKAAVERFTGSGFETETVGEAEYRVTGRILVIRIPCGLLGRADTEAEIRFKWSDNVEDGDILNFYTQGDVAPTGRFRYVYRP